MKPRTFATAVALALLPAWAAAQSPGGTGGASSSSSGAPGTTANAPAASAAGSIRTTAIGPPASLTLTVDPALARQGATLAQQGGGGAPPCMSCHGAHGEGNAAAGYPRLAAQPVGYLSRQLELYASGMRPSETMSPIAAQLSPQQRAAAAAYYATLGGAPSRGNATANAGTAAGSSTTAARGATGTSRAKVASLVDVGDATRNIQGCENCHGPQGRGEPPLFPALAGQVPGYLADSLHKWKSGARDTDPSGQMRHIGEQLSDAEIAGLSQYFAAQPAPNPALNVSPPASMASSGTGTTGASSGPSSATPTQGVGVEQGASTSGGAQGPGGGGAASGAGTTGSRNGAGSGGVAPGTGSGASGTAAPAAGENRPPR